MADENEEQSPQFQTAEFNDRPAADVCTACGQSLPDTYYRVNGSATCTSCTDKVRYATLEPGQGSFFRALMFGAGGALVGLAIYATFAIVTGWIIGFVSLAVGYIVGKAMMMGSRGVGGRKFQVAAAVLTYTAVSLAALPIAFSQWDEITGTETPAQAEQAAGDPAAQAEDKSAAGAENPPAKEESGDQGAGDESTASGETGLGPAMGMLLLIGLASPFLGLAEGASGIIGIVILFIGIQIAWKMTAGGGNEILGPFSRSKGSEQPAG